MVIPPGIQAVADHGALYAAIGQRRLAERLDAELGAHTWESNLSEGWLRFISTADPERQILARSLFIASIAPGPRSVLWGWAHPQAPDVLAAEQLRALGQQHALADLTTPEVPFETGDDLEGDVAQLAHAVAAAAVEATGRTPYYSAPVGGGSRVVFLLADIDLRPVSLPLDGAGLVSALMEAPTTNHRHAVLGFARHAGFGVRPTPDGLGDELSDGLGSTMSFAWDPVGRLVNVQANLGGTGEVGQG